MAHARHTFRRPELSFAFHLPATFGSSYVGYHKVLVNMYLMQFYTAPVDPGRLRVDGSAGCFFRRGTIPTNRV